MRSSKTSRRKDRRREELERRGAEHLAELEITMLYHEFNRAADALDPADRRTVDALWDVKTRLEEATGLDGDQIAARALQVREAQLAGERLRAGFAARDAARDAADGARWGRVLKRPAYCSKHIYSGRRLVNLYGGIHLTPGNACDGPDHHRSPWWW